MEGDKWLSTRDMVNYSNLLKKMLPKDNELPATTYEAKKIVCPLGLEVQKIHACPQQLHPLPRRVRKFGCMSRMQCIELQD